MLHHQLFGISLTMFTFIGLMFVFLRCAKWPTKIVAPGERFAVEQQAVNYVRNAKQTVFEKKAGAAKPYLGPKEANLPVD